MFPLNHGEMHNKNTSISIITSAVNKSSSFKNGETNKLGGLYIKIIIIKRLYQQYC